MTHRFNQTAGSDYADWGVNASKQVQDAFGTQYEDANTTGILNLGTNELTSLDVVGYTLSVPEPTSIAAFGLVAVAALKRRHRAKAK